MSMPNGKATHPHPLQFLHRIIEAPPFSPSILPFYLKSHLFNPHPRKLLHPPRLALPLPVPVAQGSPVVPAPRPHPGGRWEQGVDHMDTGVGAYGLFKFESCSVMQLNLCTLHLPCMSSYMIPAGSLTLHLHQWPRCCENHRRLLARVPMQSPHPASPVQMQHINLHPRIVT